MRGRAREEGLHRRATTWGVGALTFGVLGWSGAESAFLAQTGNPELAVTTSLVVAVVGAVMLAFAWRAMQRAAALREQRSLEEIDHVVLATTRDQRERLHELRSTVAGLVNGSAMIDNGDVPPEVRARMWESVRRELDRMQRLLSEHEQAVAPVDLDQALGPIVDMQRSKGRQVEIHTDGDWVQGRQDSLAEVLNILLDNAATHGGCDTSRVDVVRRDDETVDITVSDTGRGIPEEQREHIFEWGDRGADSPGEGIGLHLAQRLVAEDGGSLRLAEATGPGSTFVISLPAVRRSPEDDTTSAEAASFPRTNNHHVSDFGGEEHDTWRRSG